MENEKYFDEEWETEEEDYIRLKIENISNIKKKFNSIGKTKIRKIKKIDKENLKKISKRNVYLNDLIFPNLRILQPPKYLKNSDYPNELEFMSKIFLKSKRWEYWKFIKFKSHSFK